MFSKRPLTIVAAAGAALALSLTGCATATTPTAAPGGSAGTSAPSGEKPYIAMISKGFQHQFWQAVKTGAEKRAAELGVTITFEGPAAETEVDAQLSMFQAAIDKKPAAIAYAALDPQACVPLMDKAKEAGIPVVQFDAGCDSEVPLTTAATDSLGAGALAADKMAGLIGETGKIGIIGHSQINSTGVQRRDGFVNEIKAKFPNIEIVDIQYGDGDHLKSADLAKTMIQAHDDMVGLYGTNEGSAIGVVDAINELKLEPGKIKIVGFDSGSAQIEAIKSGVMAGAITQNPIGIGEQTVQAAFDAIQGKTIEKTIDTGFFWYDATNIADPEIAAVLYE
jgi:ribose transport system substrate-binding protein